MLLLMMKQPLVKLALIVAIAAALFAAGFQIVGKNGGGLDASQDSSRAERIKSVDFELSDLNGKPVKLSDYRGKYVLLNFWATWCPPCRAEMPDIEEAYRKYKDKGFEVVAVNLGDAAGDVRDFISENGYTFDVLLDTDGKAGGIYQVSSIPSSFFIDRDGYIIARHIGIMTEKQLAGYLELLD